MTIVSFIGSTPLKSYCLRALDLIKASVLLYLALLIAPSALQACQCDWSGNACSAFPETPIVVLVNVLEDSGEGMGTGPAKVIVEEIFHGLPPATRQISVESHAGSCFYMRLKKGERYVIYARAHPSDQTLIVRKTCSFSFPAKGNELLIETLRNFITTENPSLVGRLELLNSNLDPLNDLPFQTLVHAISKSHHFTTFTTPSGEFRFSGIPAGTYNVRFDTEHFVPAFDDSGPDLPYLPQFGCLHKRISVYPNISIAGMVFDSKGKPAPNIAIQAYSLPTRPFRTPYPAKETTTDSAGRYAFPPLPVGEYVIGANTGGPMNDPPALPIFYKNVDTFINATRLKITPREKLLPVNLTLSPYRKAAKVEITFVDETGNSVNATYAKLVCLTGSKHVRDLILWPSPSANSSAYVGETYIVKVGSKAMNLEGQTREFKVTKPFLKLRIVLRPTTYSYLPPF